ncbi:winged helix DNA-binding domain-containing protein [Sorangium sp. So ce1036]|uniref:winged helix DNA-binding domain-containing protein n=1 Tax=Sorangium sp. So ce1036 TaxID=3133328 RepID=UPI003F126F96
MLLSRERTTAVRGIERLIALQAQLARPPFLGLWSRLVGFRREELVQRALRREVVRAPFLRGTLHLVSAKDYLALRPVIAPVLHAAMRSTLGARAEALDVDRLVAEARAYFDEEPRTMEELRAHLAEIHPEGDVRAMALAVRMRLPVVQVPTETPWGYPGTADFAPAASWLGQPLCEGDAPEALVLRYLASFGPATAADVRTWSGLTGVKDVLQSLREQLCTFRDERGRELFDLPRHLRRGPTVGGPPRHLRRRPAARRPRRHPRRGPAAERPPGPGDEARRRWRTCRSPASKQEDKKTERPFDGGGGTVTGALPCTDSRMRANVCPTCFRRFSPRKRSAPFSPARSRLQPWHPGGPRRVARRYRNTPSWSSASALRRSAGLRPAAGRRSPLVHPPPRPPGCSTLPPRPAAEASGMLDPTPTPRRRGLRDARPYPTPRRRGLRDARPYPHAPPPRPPGCSTLPPRPAAEASGMLDPRGDGWHRLKRAAAAAHQPTITCCQVGVLRAM